MITYECRELIRQLDENGQIQHIEEPVDPIHEVAAILRTVRGTKTMMFHHITGYETPLVSGLGGTREKMAASMGIDKSQLTQHLIKAIAYPKPTHYIEQAPVHDNIVLAPVDVKQYFPILKYHREDAGQFLVSGILVVKDLSGQKHYTSIRRLQYLNRNQFGILISSPELFSQYLQLEKSNQPMEFALMFGVVPAVVLSSQISTHLFHADKLHVAGALLDQSLPVVKAKTVNIDVLAHAEVVIEGKILPHQRQLEGPFGELGGYYGDATMQPICEVTALTYRNNPIWQTIYPSGHEEHLPMALAREAHLYSIVKGVIPELQRVYVTAGGIGRYHAVLQINKKTEGDAKQALLAAFASDKDLKHVVCVDEDVNIYDPLDVEWAIATRVQADMDVFIVAGAKGSPLEPSHQLRGVSAKMGIDATYPIAQASAYKRTDIPTPAHLLTKLGLN